ncbi:ankyrin repeat and SOCS box protein 1-like isoform X2 [Periplaneta americana]|uniref:ankyrin repeat and SOCS box protein 1-like isoform X2 n=1 Tax=Periplaneta americana TaxID=6978 RepID=UPI0037E82B54
MHLSKTVASELDAFIVDNEDGQFDDSLHQAAWRGDQEELARLLRQSTANIDLRLRPFYATPLRLAAMNRHRHCVAMLTQYGCRVDLEDRKAQTPLYCAVRNWDSDSCYVLLRAGASPEGSGRNMTTPLQNACTDGYEAGVKMLLDFGADIESPDPRATWKHPLYITVAYRHLNSFILLLEAGADVSRTAYILHTICNKMCSAAFVHLWVQFGGNLWHKDEKGQLAVDMPGNKHRALLLELMSTPLTLKSLCRLKIRKKIGRFRFPRMARFNIPQVLIDFLYYRDIEEVNKIMKDITFVLEGIRKTNYY